MTTSEQWLRVGLEFDSEIEKRDLDQIRRTLEQELRTSELKVAVSSAPEAFDPTALGPVLLLAASTSVPLGAAAKLLGPKLLSVLKGWLARDRRRHVRIRVGKQVLELELADASSEEQSRLVGALVAAIEQGAEGRRS